MGKKEEDKTKAAPDKYVTVQIVAETLSCTERHIYRLIIDGKIKAIKIGPRALRISRNSLQEFIEAGKVNPEDYFA